MVSVAASLVSFVDKIICDSARIGIDVPPSARALGDNIDRTCGYSVAHQRRFHCLPATAGKT